MTSKNLSDFFNILEIYQVGEKSGVGGEKSGYLCCCMVCRGCKRTQLTQSTEKGQFQGIAYPEPKLKGMETVLRSSSTVSPLGTNSAQMQDPTGAITHVY